MSKYLGICGTAAFALAIGLSNPAGAKIGAHCGGFIISPFCGEHEFCQSPTGACLKFDIGGTCVAKPDQCILRKGVFYIPECGCNGVTYANDCERRKAGVSMAHKGKCT
jgi:hypothetical protein